MDTIFEIFPGESFSGIHALEDLFVCVNKYQQLSQIISINYLDLDQAYATHEFQAQSKSVTPQNF